MIHVDPELCDACGRCGRVCPRYVVETVKGEDGEKVTRVHPERSAICIDCGQCMAICKTGAIRVDGIEPDDLVPTPAVDCTPEQVMTLLQHRRSVRRYKKKAVPRDVIDQVVEAVRWSPTAASKGRLGITIVDDEEKLAELRKRMYAFFEMVDGMLASPLKRWFMVRRAGKRKVETLRGHAMPGVRWYGRWYREGRSDELTRDCPVIMLFHAPESEPSGDESCIIASWQAVVMAESLGLGTCFNGLIPSACNKVPGIREMLGLAGDREIHASLTMGWPKYGYPRTIRRRLAEVRYL